MIKKTCICGNVFFCWPYEERMNKGKFCSSKCFGDTIRGKKNFKISLAMTGRSSPNKGKHIRTNTGRTHFKKGVHYSPSTEFKKGIIPHNYSGGITKKQGGYIMEKIAGHPGIGKFGYIKRSHLVIEKFIKRYIKRGEIVHHINGITEDDTPGNLILFSSSSAHGRFHFYPERVLPEEIIFDGRKLSLPLDYGKSDSGIELGAR